MPKHIKGSVYVKGKSAEKLQRSKETDKLDSLAGDISQVIFELSSVFPFQLFPDKIVIDKSKVTIVRRELFFVRLFPILYEDIQTVRINRGILLASLDFEVRGYEQNPRPITHLWPDQAAKAEKYILGLIDIKREGIDVSKVATDKIKKKAEEIEKLGEDEGNLI